MELITDHMPEMTEEELNEALSLAIYESNKYGLTGVHDAGCPKSEIDFYKK